MNWMDYLYLSGLLVVWGGNIKQVRWTIKSGSTKSFELVWPFALLYSFLARMPRAINSDFWVWKAGYVGSVIIILVMVGVIVYYRKRYPGK